MHVACASYGWFIFNLNVEISSFTDHILQYSYVVERSTQPNPLPLIAPSLLTWRTSLLAHGGEYQSTLVSGLLTTAPPFASSPTLSHPEDQVTVFTYMTSTTSAVLVWHS
jgi:hypothetical protein